MMFQGEEDDALITALDCSRAIGSDKGGAVAATTMQGQQRCGGSGYDTTAMTHWQSSQ